MAVNTWSRETLNTKGPTSKLKTLELWISRSMLNLFFLVYLKIILIFNSKNATSEHEVNKSRRAKRNSVGISKRRKKSKLSRNQNCPQWKFRLSDIGIQDIQFYSFQLMMFSIFLHFIGCVQRKKEKKKLYSDSDFCID